ncbi:MULTISPECIES: helix-turn-helix domain-containing protein [Paenibacillus]|uniref:helix-turn-helix domain-containing protein n=1 Tax=Paenibacillus TaxID=44249 RepID=UPI0022B91F0C|nr:helix-turn-helix domain-containing protein [Paenibacillus caseinilyticus]MCZ8520160.1 helix-turn-helix domain-containing protein [Paenibacillus caseinilyticus]
MSEKRLTVFELADRWGVHHDTVYTMVRKKELPHFRVGNRILFREASIQKWELEQELRSTNAS